MKVVRSAALGCAVAALFGVSQPLPASAQDNIDNVFLQTDLRQALEDIAAQADVNIIADPSVQGIVSVTLDDVDIDTALELVLAGTGYQVAREPDYFFVFNPDAGADFFTDVARTRRVELETLQPSAARSLLAQPLQRYVQVDDEAERVAVTAPPEILERIVSDLTALDRDEDRRTELYALEFIRAERARDLLPDNLQRYVRVDPDRNTVAITAREENRREVIGLLRSLDVERGPSRAELPDIYPVHLVKLQHARAESAMNLLPEAAVTYVRADEESNTLSISAPSQLVGDIRHSINTIDSPKPHVMLDARVVALEQGNLLDFGTDFQWPQIQSGTVFGDAPDADFPWEVRIGYTPDRQFTNALSLTLNFLSANEEATVISSPQVLAQDGSSSAIRVTTEEFFEIGSDDAAFARAQLEEIETGTILSITPQIGGSGELTLNMDLEVSDVVGRGEGNLPVVSRRSAQSTVRIQDGGTAAVAGLVDTRAQSSSSGVPGIRSVPLLGRLFGSENLDHRARQVAIFVTANIVDEDGQRFRTGAQPAPKIRDISDDQFRAELEAALPPESGDAQ